MNLLVLTNNPARPSFRQRLEVHLDLLRRNGINCEVARLPAGLAARCRFLKRSADFDAVFLQKKRLNLIEAPLLRRYARRIIYDFDDAVMYKPAAPERYSLLKSVRFRLTVGLADLVIAGNPYLAEHARKFNTKVEVLPTGLNIKDYRIAAARKDNGKVRLVWIGSRSTLRYLAEIAPALEEIGSRYENVILRMVCNDFIDLERMSVEKCLWSEQTQAADLVSSDIGLAPLPDNRFTRGKCGFKILQYASAGLPVVASPVGVNRDYVQDHITGYFASDTEQWVDRISRLVENAQLRKKMGQSAGKSVERFDISVIGEQLAALILQCADGVRLYHSDRLVNCLDSGTFTLAGRVPDSDLLFKDGVHLKYCDSPDEFCELADWYLKHDQEREKITRAGMQRAHSEFNCVKVAQCVIDLIDKGSYEAPWAEIL